MNRTDLADPAAGLLATLEGNVPLAIFERAGSGDEAELKLDRRETATEVFLEGALLGRWQVRACEMPGELRAGENNTRIDATGANTVARPLGDPAEPDRAALRRSVVIVFEDGALLALAAARRDARGGNDEEEISAALAEPGTRTSGNGEVMLSTEYGPDKVQRRATIEIREHEDDSRIVRGAGRVITATRLQLPGATSDIAFFEWSVEGRPGIGRYEIIRAT